VNEFAWNALRVNDRVVVTEHRSEVYGHPTGATVVFVHHHPRHNDVGMHRDDDPRSLTRWLTRFEVSPATS
jgi:hypothetical protein